MSENAIERIIELAGGCGGATEDELERLADYVRELHGFIEEVADIFITPNPMVMADRLSEVRLKAIKLQGMNP